MKRNTLFLIAGVALIALALVLAWSQLNPNSTPTAPSSSAVEDVHDSSGVPYPNVARLELTDAKARYDAKSAVFVDVRGQSDYAAAHIPGALSLPLGELEARLAELPRDREILTYCT